MAKVMNMMVSIGNEVIGENDTGDDEAGMDSGGYGGYDRPAALRVFTILAVLSAS